MENAQPPIAPRIEIMRPLSHAWDHMVSMLFPFNFERWLTLAFVAWLAMLGRGMGVNFPTSFTHKTGGQPSVDVRSIMEQAAQFVQSHLPIILTVGAILFAVIFAIGAAISYLSARGLFMYMDCIARRKAAVQEPWTRAREKARQLFLARLVLMAVTWAILLSVGILILIQLLPAFRTGTFGNDQIVLIALWAIVLLPVCLALALAGYVINNLVAPIMYLRDMRIGAAWKDLCRIARGNLGAFILFAAMHWVVWLGYAFAIFPAIRLTCCLAWFPVAQQFVLQPLIMWARAYPLYFLAQFGPEYAAAIQPKAPQFPASAPASPASAPQPTEPQTSLQEPAAPAIAACPHCGQAHQIPGGAAGRYACTRCGGVFDVH